MKLSVTPLQLKVQQISDDLSKPLPVDLQATLNKKGTLGVKGDVTATPLKVAVKVNANRLDAAAFEPYFGSKLNALIASALLNANGDLALSQAKALKATYRGDVALVDVRMIDKATSDPFAGWSSLALTNLKADYDEHGTVVDAGRVTFTKFYGRVLLDAQGKLNLKDVVAHESGAAQSLTRDKSGGHEPVPLTPQAASAPELASAPVPASSATPATVTAATPPQSPVKLHFGQLVLQQGRVTYTDNFIKPNFTANLVGIQGTVGAFGTQSTTSAPVDIAAKLAANGPLSIRGTVNPLIAKPALDLTASAHDIELTNLTPYSAKYAGYPITKGKLNVDLHYKLDNDQLNANNHIFIDQLTFGDHVENNTATKLPVRLAISLLKNSRGEIDVNLPVSGSLSNPEFSIGGLIWHAVLNLLEKAVTAPFSLIANAFGGSGEELGYVEFEPGSAQAFRRCGQEARHDREGAGRQEFDPYRSDRPCRSGCRRTGAARAIRRPPGQAAEDQGRGGQWRERRSVDRYRGSEGIRQVPDQGLQGGRLQEAAQFCRLDQEPAGRRDEERDGRQRSDRRRQLAAARAATGASRAAVFRRQDRQQPRVYRRAEAER